MNSNIDELLRILFYTITAYVKFNFLDVNITKKLTKFGKYRGSILFRGKQNLFSIGEYSNFMGNCSFIFGRNNSGILRVGNKVTIESSSTLAPRDGEIKIGDHVFIGTNVLIQAYAKSAINIGNNVMIAKDVNIFASNHDISNPLLGYHEEIGNSISIGSNVWIGSKVTILAGVNIGNNAVIAAGTVVSRDIEPFSLNTGIPSKKIKYFDFNNNTWVKVK